MWSVSPCPKIITWSGFHWRLFNVTTLWPHVWRLTQNLIVFALRFQFKSYCSSHRPVQKVKHMGGSRSEPSKICGICHEEVGNVPSPKSIWTPCCGSFYHPACVQSSALSAGVYNFRSVLVYSLFWWPTAFVGFVCLCVKSILIFTVALVSWEVRTIFLVSLKSIV